MGKLRLRIHKPQQDCREEKENEWICKSENKSDTTYLVNLKCMVYQNILVYYKVLILCSLIRKIF
jgi:hypothetical protein